MLKVVWTEVVLLQKRNCSANQIKTVSLPHLQNRTFLLRRMRRHNGKIFRTFSNIGRKNEIVGMLPDANESVFVYIELRREHPIIGLIKNNVVPGPGL